MYAWRYVGQSRPLERDEVPDPEPGPGEVVVRMHAAGLCHSDLHAIDMGDLWGVPVPLTLGHEGAGEVAAVGDGVGELRPGARVALLGVNPCRRCRLCRLGTENLCQERRHLGLRVDGMFAEYVRSDAYAAVPLPVAVGFEAAAVATDSVLTPYRAIRTIGAVGDGDRVAILGAGGLGLHAVQIAKLLGADVTAVDPASDKRQMALDNGADAVSASSGEIDPQSIDVVVDLVGLPETHLGAQSICRPGGRIVLVGFGALEGPLVAWRFGSHEISILGTFWGTRRELEECLELVADGRIRPVFEVHPMDDVNRQIERLRDGGVRGRVALTV